MNAIKRGHAAFLLLLVPHLASTLLSRSQTTFVSTPCLTSDRPRIRASQYSYSYRTNCNRQRPCALIERIVAYDAHTVSDAVSSEPHHPKNTSKSSATSSQLQSLTRQPSPKSTNSEDKARIHNKAPSNLYLPRHIAFICDGNSRWARQNMLPKSMGHAAGADRVMNTITSLKQRQTLSQLTTTDGEDTRKQHTIEYCTLFAFSTENWSRPSSEITTLFKLMERIAIQYRQHDAIREGKIQIDLLGDLNDERIPEGARRELQRLQIESHNICNRRREENAHADILTICLAINYGGRADILQAARSLAQSIASGELSLDAIHNESEISKRLSTVHLPDPDLVIRTGGEKRLSNFLLWNAAYAELYFTDILWPDFDNEALEEALVWYGDRSRRFGGRE